MLYLGIDQHSKQLTVNLRNEAGDVMLHRQVSTQPTKVRQFFEELARRAQPEGGYVAIVEVCGFNDWLLDLLPTVGCREVVLVQPTRRSRRKTDFRDAAALSELLWVNRGRLLGGHGIQGLRRVYIATATEREGRKLTALRREKGAERTQIINRIKHLLACRNLQHDCPTKGIQTAGARQWLQDLPVETLGALDRLALNQELEKWKLLDRQLKQLTVLIEEQKARHPQARMLSSIPGCGAYTALAIATRVAGVERFRSPRSLANYFGLVPGCRNSGEATQRLGSITKQGSPIVRFLLGQLVLHVLRRDPWMRAWYKKLRQRRGSKIARVAVMRRVTTIIWHMLTKQEAYQPGGPPRQRLALRKV